MRQAEARKKKQHDDNIFTGQQHDSISKQKFNTLTARKGF